MRHPQAFGVIEVIADLNNRIYFQEHYTYLPRTGEWVEKLYLNRRRGTDLPEGNCPYCSTLCRLGQKFCPGCGGEFKEAKHA